MEESPALTTALKAFSILTREQKAVLSRTLEGFVDSLAPATNPNPNASSVATENSWHNRANWSEAEWVAWETWGWYRHFCRMVRNIDPLRIRFKVLTFDSVLSLLAQLFNDPRHHLLRQSW